MSSQFVLLLWLTQLWCACAAGSSAASNGWGDAIEWTSLEEGVAQARDADKPLMLIIHKPWCGACKSLKARFSESPPPASLSSRFVMVNVQEDEELGNDTGYSPDGNYYPRILFFSSSGEFLSNVFNEHGDSNYKYYYYNPAHIVEAMEHVVNRQTANDRPVDEL